MEFFLLTFSSLFVIVDPLATAPAFLSMTRTNTPEQRKQMARMACMTTGAILILMAMFGQWIFRVLGISFPAFHIAGGLVMGIIAWDMLQARRSSLQETHEEMDAGVIKKDVAITPLAIPMLAGPGAIVTVILLQSRAVGWLQTLGVYGCIVLVSWVSYILFCMAARGDAILGPIASRIFARLMGLFLMAVAVQFVINGVTLCVQGMGMAR